MSEGPRYRRNNFKAAAWRAYYQGQANCYLEIAERLEKFYPKVAQNARDNASRFMEGVSEIDSKTHPNLISGKWK